MVAVSQDNKGAFLSWAISVFPAQRCKWIEKNILKIEQFAVASKLISGSIFYVTDIATLETIDKAATKNRIFQIKNRKFIKNINDDFKAYMQYCSQPLEQAKQMYESEIPIVETTVNSARVGVAPTAYEAEFYAYLRNTAKLADRTCVSYVSSIRSAERYAANNSYTSCLLFCENKEATVATATELYGDSDFIRYNEQQHNRFSAAINKLLGFIGAEIPKKAVVSLDGSNEDRAVVSTERNGEIVALLNQHYKYGFKIDSLRERMRFRQFADTIGITLPEEDEALKASILSSGVVIGDRVYCENDDMLQELQCIVDDVFSSGVGVIYYESLFENEQEWMESHVVTSPDILKEYLQKSIAGCSFSKKFMVKGCRRSEKEAVTNELKRVW